ncbi:hypothetical protein [Leptolyngbya sp. FACHB-261]|uniref:hypothetical protein n=1 Tax=Leptolyngbya sp. FACHB-261 TaxID=2692806 RepID=UPI00168290F9|nr:hypothetical protein [Leptolyngbya sp. FACHB-261]MBD2101053.1 hypothetical protein [Leptolyngbya sp. FACHB-261]
MLGLFITSPSQAATLASSQGIFKLDNFNQNSNAVRTFTDVNSLAIAPSGTVDASAQADALFSNLPALASNTSLSQVTGDGSNYLGLAQSRAQVVGDFLTEAGQSFSFNFAGSLALATSTDNPQSEHARATGSLSLLVFDSTNSAQPTLLDFLVISGQLVTFGAGDFLNFEKSQNITFDLGSPSFQQSFGSKQESAGASVKGSLQRSFASATRLTIVEVNSNQASVKTVPEPSNLLALLFIGWLAVRIRAKAILA